MNSYLFEVPRIGNTSETERRREVSRGWREGGMGIYYLMRFYWENEKVWKQTVVMVVQHGECAKCY